MNCTFGNTLREERKKKGWTRTKLYMEINKLSTKNVQLLSIETLGNYENNRTLPDFMATVALARVYKRPDLLNLRAEAVEFMKRKVCI